VLTLLPSCRRPVQACSTGPTQACSTA